MLVKDDKEYVTSLKEGDFNAFDALFAKYAKSLFAFALSITKNRFAAEEITQLVFVKIWENKDQISDHYSFKSFLFSVAYHETISWIRMEKSQKIRITNFGLNYSDESLETEQCVEFTDMEQVANGFIEAMPEKRKIIFKLSREQGLTNKEIAEKLNISVKTVENQMTSALKYLREKLGHYHILGLLFYFLFFH
jgi:RNA polymerase sigma-70 factor (ECF subfamily)